MDHIKKQGKRQASYLVTKLLTTHSISCTALITSCVCSCINNSSWLATYIHACTNETYSIANLQDLIPTLALVVCVAYNYCYQNRD